jgi:ATP-dependent 26S proteasome regulatory subunit
MPIAKLPFPGGPPADILKSLIDGKKPAATKAKILKGVLINLLDNEAALDQLLTSVVERLAPPPAPPAPQAEEQAKARYEEILAEMERGPVRPATYVGPVEEDLPGPISHVCVVTPDGHERFPLLREGMKVEDLEPGATLFLDAKGGIVLGKTSKMPETGVAAEFIRRVPGGNNIEVRVRDDRFILRASKAVTDAVGCDKLRRGGRVLISPNREFAFRVLPAEKDRKYRFVDASKVPQVIAGRDIGKPHWALGWLIRRARILLFRRDLLARFDLRPRVSLLMTGPSGVGKTLHIRCFLRELSEMLRARTGRDDLGSRLIRVKVSEQLSEWLGRADKNLEELFDDIYALASEEIETADGERILAPVCVLLEEVESLGRRRGEHNGAIYDRILGTLLQRLDDPTDDLSKLPIIIISSSNRPELLDPAMARRLAGVRAHFGRLDRSGFAAVLAKKIRPGSPLASLNGHGPEELRRTLLDQVIAWFYSPNGEDAGVVEITLADGKKLVKHRRDFLTGAVVEQAVSNAIDEMVLSAEESGRVDEAGFSAPALIESFRRQIDAIADTLTRANVVEYLDLPEHTTVATVRRLIGSIPPLAAASRE